MKRTWLGGLVTVVVVLACMAAPAFAAGVEHLHYHAGPYKVTPGANLILLQTNQVPKPKEDGYMIRMQPNLRYARPDGSCCAGVPRVDVIHLHHGVWLSNGQAGAGEGNGYIGGVYPFMAVGEEKTIFEMPSGYGYRGRRLWGITEEAIDAFDELVDSTMTPSAEPRPTEEHQRRLLGYIVDDLIGPNDALADGAKEMIRPGVRPF